MILFLFSTIFAQEPEKSKDILLTTPPTEEQSTLLHDVLEKYLKDSTEIFIGVLQDTRPVRSQLSFDTMAYFEVVSWLKGGDNEDSIECLLPYRSPYTEGNPLSVPPVLIQGYKMLVFVNRYDAVVDGNAIFVVLEEHAFRNKNPNVFLNPRYDRIWLTGNPHNDYFIYSLADIQKSIKKNTVVLKRY